MKCVACGRSYQPAQATAPFAAGGTGMTNGACACGGTAFAGDARCGEYNFAAMQRDAERYRHLRNRGDEELADGRMVHVVRELEDGTRVGLLYEALDAEVDAAMAEHPVLHNVGGNAQTPR